MTFNRLVRETSTYLAWQSHLGVELQISRLRESSPGAKEGDGRQLVDVTGLILALWRLRLAAEMPHRIENSDDSLAPALATFDRAVPNLTKLRNVTMHFDNYATGTGDRKNTVGEPPRLVEAKDLWALRCDAAGFEWLEVRADYETTETAARALYDAIQKENNSRLDL